MHVPLSPTLSTWGLVKLGGPPFAKEAHVRKRLQFVYTIYLWALSTPARGAAAPLAPPAPSPGRQGKQLSCFPDNRVFREPFVKGFRGISSAAKYAASGIPRFP